MKRWLADERVRAAALLVFTTLLWLRTLALPLHYVDDVVYLDDPRVGELSLANLWSILTRSYLANYHPVTTLTYAIDRALFGAWLPGYHVTHLAFYLVGVWLAYRLLTRLLDDAAAAWLAAALFAAHTLHVEVVAWLAQRKDVVCLVFYVAALLAYVRWVKSERRDRRAYAAAVVLSLVAMLSKGYAVVLPGVMLAYDLCFTPKFNKRAILDKLPIVAAAAAVTVLTFLAQDKDSALMAAVQITPGQRLTANAMVLAAYVGRSLLPVDLSFSYAVGPFWLSVPVALLGGALAAGAVWGFVALRRRHPAAAFGIALYVLPLGTVMNVFWTLATWMNDRYLFLPTLGSSLLLAALALRLPRRIAAAVAVVALVVYSGLTQVRIDVWKSEVALRSDALRQQLDLGGEGPVTAADIRKKRVAVLPNLNAFLSLIVAYNRAGNAKEATALKLVFAGLQEGGDMESKLSIAKQEIDTGKVDEAIARLRPAAESSHWMAAEAWNLIAVAHEKARRLPEARHAYEQAVTRLEKKGMAATGPLLRLGSIDLEQGHTEEAVAWYRRALAAATPNDPRPAFRLATALERAGSLEEAQAMCDRALAMQGSVAPTITFEFADARVIASQIAEKRRQPALALEHLTFALELSKDSTQRRQISVKRALLMEAAGRDADALVALEQIVRDDPQHPEFPTLLVRASEIAERGKYPARAIGYLEKLLVQAPNYGERAQVMLKIGVLCEQAGRVHDAIASYERALAAAPDYPDRAAVRARIALLKSKL